MEELKFCPFCGEQPKRYFMPDLINQEYWVRCINNSCCIYQKRIGTKAWNTRAKE